MPSLPTTLTLPESPGRLQGRDHAHRHLVVGRVDADDVAVGLQHVGHDVQGLAAVELRRLGRDDGDAGERLDAGLEALAALLGDARAHDALDLDDLALAADGLAERLGAVLAGLDGVVADEGLEVAALRHAVEGHDRHAGGVGLADDRAAGRARDGVDDQHGRLLAQRGRGQVQRGLVGVVGVLHVDVRAQGLRLGLGPVGHGDEERVVEGADHQRRGRGLAAPASAEGLLRLHAASERAVDAARATVRTDLIRMVEPFCWEVR